MPSRSALWRAAPLLVLTCAACVSSVPDAAPPASSEGGADGGGEGGGGDDAGDGGNPGLPEPALPCDPNEKPADGMFVAPDGDDSAGNGSALLPYKTIKAAMTAAIAAGKHDITLAEGTYAETVTFDAAHQGLFLHGGWTRAGDAWKRDCVDGFRTKTILASPSAVGVRVDTVTTASGLDALSVATKGSGASPTDATGESCIGVMVTGAGSVFRLYEVKVVAGNGGKGGNPSPRSQAGNVACNGTNDCSASSPAEGNPGPAGGAANTRGTFGANGFTPSNGSDGKPGITGANGTPGTAGSAMTCATPGQGQCQSGGDQCVHAASPAGNAGPGTCGCGGLAGSGGAAGHGGGASVALFVSGAGSKVAIEATALVAANGGDGAVGGAGGLGGAGTAGAVGQSRTCPQDNGPNMSPGPSCGCIGKSDMTFSGGPAGGAGAPGSEGGNGGGGAGGDAYSQVTIGDAQVLVTGDASLSQTAVGSGGKGVVAGGAGASLTAP